MSFTTGLATLISGTGIAPRAASFLSPHPASNGISVRMMYISFFIYGYGLGIITQFSLYPPPSAWYNDTRYSSELPSACVNWFSYVSSERSASSTFWKGLSPCL